MTVLHRGRSRAGRLLLGAWVAAACTPAGWALGIALAFASGEGDAQGPGPVALGLLGVVVFVAAPVTAVCLAAEARRAGHRRSRVAVAVSGALLLLTIIATSLVGLLAFAVAAVATAAALGVVWLRSRRVPPTP